MPVPGLPERIHIGRVVVEQADGPFFTQRTHVLQRPGWRVTYLKHMDQSAFAVGDGYRLTVCTIDVEVEDGRDLSVALARWRDAALAAVAFVTALLDERIAQEVLADDLLLFSPDGTVNAVADHVTQVREFTPTNRVLNNDRELLADLTSVEPGAETPLHAAARWYLRAVQGGVRPDAIVFFWIALEALAKPPYGTKLTGAQRKLSDVEWVEQALDAAGLPPGQVQPSVGRLAGLRAEVVHGGVEAPTLLREGYYALEVLVRLLLRDKLGLDAASWPLNPGVTNLREPFATAARLLGSPRTQWRPSPGGDGSAGAP